jgi:hypothetical protein
MATYAGVRFGGCGRAPLFLPEPALNGLGMAGPKASWPWLAARGGHGWMPSALVILGRSGLEWMELGACFVRVTDAEVSWLAFPPSSS